MGRDGRHRQVDRRPNRYTLHVLLPPLAPSRFVCECRCGWRSDPVGVADIASSLWRRHVAERDCPEFPDLEVEQ